MDNLDVPPDYVPPPPPKRLVRPKITLQIPPTSNPMTPRGAATGTSIYWGPPRLHRTPATASSHVSDPHGNFNPFMHMYQNKASEFMFKQFEGFKDFTVNTAKSGLSAGEKSAFWFYNKLKLLSRRWFTHLFLSFFLVLYSVGGGALFMSLEGPNEVKWDKNLTATRKELAAKIHNFVIANHSLILENDNSIFELLEQDLPEYELIFMECSKHTVNNNTTQKTWTFWNSMFYAGTIYTTIG